MRIEISSNTAHVGSIVIDSNEMGWLYKGEEIMGRIEVDWGGENQEHMASIFIHGDCLATITLDRYGKSIGKINRGFSEIGRVEPAGSGVCSVFKGSDVVGRLESKDSNISMKHIILFGGVGAAVLLGISTS
jgi:hypothetical protein